MYINIIFKQISTFNVLLKNISRIKTHNLSKITNISLHFNSFIIVKQNFKLQKKLQATQQHNKAKLKNTCRIK